MPLILDHPPTGGAAGAAALARWLGIAGPADDAALIRHVDAALAIAEAFIGWWLIERDAAVTLPVAGGWQPIPAAPVRAITAVTGLPAEGPAFLLPADAYAIDIMAQGCGQVRVLRPGSAGRVEIAFRAGLAADWDGLPDAVAQGVIRLAAHDFRRRDDGAADDPPAAIAALWRPFRRMRLA